LFITIEPFFLLLSFSFVLTSYGLVPLLSLFEIAHDLPFTTSGGGDQEIPFCGFLIRIFLKTYFCVLIQERKIHFQEIPPNTAPLRGIFDVHPIPDKVRWGRGGGSRRVFRPFAWLEVGSDKAASSRPAHQRVPRRERAGQAVGQCSRTPI
jgi:hypothetical protein